MNASLAAGIKFDFDDSGIILNAEQTYVCLTANYGMDVHLDVLNQGTGIGTFVGDPVHYTVYGRCRVPRLESPDDVQTDSNSELSGTEPGIAPTEGQSFLKMGVTSGATAPSFAPTVAISSEGSEPFSTARLTAPLNDFTVEIVFDVNVLADTSALTAGKHRLRTFLVNSTGTELELGPLELSDFALSPSTYSLGFASGWQTVRLAVPQDRLGPEGIYRLEWRYETDRTSETASVAIDGVQFTAPASAIAVTTPDGDLRDGLTFGAESRLRPIATVGVENLGTAALNITDIDVIGAGFEVVLDSSNLIGQPLAIFPDGGVLEVPIRLTDPTRPASGTLRLIPNDPINGSLEVPLEYGTLLHDPSNVVNGTIRIYGGDGDDMFTFSTGAMHLVEVNGTPFEYDPAVVSVIRFDGGPGDDALVIEGTAYDEEAILDPGRVNFFSTSFEVRGAALETIDVRSGGGGDTATLRDSEGDDLFEAGPTSATLSGAAFSNTVRGFARVDGYGRSGGTDRCRLYDSAGHDVFRGRSTVSYLNGDDFVNYARGFSRVDAFSDAGGSDRGHSLPESAGRKPARILEPPSALPRLTGCQTAPSETTTARTDRGPNL